jgi:hypothetical protein
MQDCRPYTCMHVEVGHFVYRAIMELIYSRKMTMPMYLQVFNFAQKQPVTVKT